VAALAPLALAARAGAARANELDAKAMKKTRNVIEIETTESHPTRNIMAIVACGAAVGAAGALVARRRNRAKWAEYEPSSLESDATSMLDPNTTATTSMSGTGQPGMVKKATGWTKGHSKTAVDSMRHKIHDATADREGMGMESGGMSGSEMSDDTRDAMRRSSEKGNEGSSHFAGDAEGNMSSGEAVDDMMRSNKNGRR
jgi:hypothetical protein